MTRVYHCSCGEQQYVGERRHPFSAHYDPEGQLRMWVDWHREAGHEIERIG